MIKKAISVFLSLFYCMSHEFCFVFCNFRPILNCEISAGKIWLYHEAGIS